MTRWCGGGGVGGPEAGREAGKLQLAGINQHHFLPSLFFLSFPTLAPFLAQQSLRCITGFDAAIWTSASLIVVAITITRSSHCSLSPQPARLLQRFAEGTVGQPHSWPSDGTFLATATTTTIDTIRYDTIRYNLIQTRASETALKMQSASQHTRLPLLLHLITALLLLYVQPGQASPPPSESWGRLRGISWPALFGRGSCSTTCGWNKQLCCSSGEACYTDSNDQAQCTATSSSSSGGWTTSGYWEWYTTVYTETDLVTVTSTYSSWYDTTTSCATATATAVISCGSGESSCGDICCASDQYCYVSGQCKASGSGATTSWYYTSTNSYSAPLQATSNTVVVVTATSSPTTTVPFVAPVATGANVTLTDTGTHHSSGLSGGAIAGIVIGVLLGVFLLFLICLYCCFRGLWVALFGGRNRKRTTEREEYYESHRHRSGSGAAGGGRRTWYGSRPTRVETRKEKKSGGFGEMLGIGAGLAGLAAVLGMKRHHDRRRQDEKSDLSSNYYSYYTSESE